METLSPKRIQRGRLMLIIPLVIFVVLHIVAVTVFVLKLGVNGIDSLFYWQIAFFILCAFGTHRGSIPIRYIFAFLLALGVLPSWALIQGQESFNLLSAALIFDFILRLGLCYLIMIDDRVNTFFLSQRARNFGKRVRIAVGENGETASGSSKRKKKKKTSQRKEDAWEEVDSLYEDEDV